MESRFIWRVTSYTLPPLLLSMFQCIVKIDESYDLKIMKSYLENDISIQVKAFAPGSLGFVIKDDIFQIGSLSIKLAVNNMNVSILMFKNKTLKISGGLNRMEANTITNGTFDTYLQDSVITPIIDILFRKKDVIWQVQKKMINGSLFRETPIGKSNYLSFITKIKSKFHTQHVILPEVMQTQGKKRGRICAVKVKHHGGQGTFAVDHSGKVQFFAYNDVEHMRLHASQLEEVWV